jgi:AcrR family transcriptional regulator
LFLTQGFDLTNCEQVVAEAGAGKASLYARYANKQELFTAVVQRNVSDLRTHQLAPVPVGLGVQERLRTAGNLILEHALREHVVALMRLVISTAYRLPDLAKLTDTIGRDRGMQVAAEAIARPRSDVAEVLRQAMPAATKFIDLAFVPLQMRALLGEDLGTLVAQGPQAVDDAVALLDSGGWLEGWP